MNPWLVFGIVCAVIVIAGALEYHSRESYLKFHLSAGDAAVDANDQFVNVIMRGAVILLVCFFAAGLWSLSPRIHLWFFSLLLVSGGIASVVLVCWGIGLSLKWGRLALQSHHEARRRENRRMENLLLSSSPSLAIRTARHLEGN